MMNRNLELEEKLDVKTSPKVSPYIALKFVTFLNNTVYAWWRWEFCVGQNIKCLLINSVLTITSAMILVQRVKSSQVTRTSRFTTDISL